MLLPSTYEDTKKGLKDFFFQSYVDYKIDKYSAANLPYTVELNHIWARHIKYRVH